MLSRIMLLTCVAALVGCGGSYYEQNLATHLPRADGSKLSVQCVSYVKHTVSSISPKLDPEPRVEIVLGERTFTISNDQILLNGNPYASLKSGVKEVFITINEDGLEVTADGEPVAL